ncbi:MAG TPA: STAS domain-containing protein [Frankiaceae bacterium]|jgi:anti-anti-sigma factor|nr:STAS domain-containing protein [Frankiaceae bacterium]
MTFVKSTPPIAHRDGKEHRLELAFVRDRAEVRILGEIDVLAAPDLTRLLESLDLLATTVHVDLGPVTFIDSAGLKPLIEATRRRRRDAMPPLVFDACSRQVRRLLDCAGLGGDPLLDVDAWDTLAVAALYPPGRYAAKRRRCTRPSLS